MASSNDLPRFVIIGAVKAATTWIHDQLQQHPAIYLPGPEPHYFSQDYALGLEHYRSLFAAAAPGSALGEKSADYFAHPEAPARLAATLPGARLVLQLRDPVERAYSDYKMLFRRGTVTGPPEHYLDGRACDQPRFLEDGLYAKHLTRWLDHVDAETLHILLFEDVTAAPMETISAVCSHIGVPFHYSTHVGEGARNNSRERFLPLPIRTALAPLKRAARPLRGEPIFEGVRALFAREIAYPPLSPSLRRRLADFYAPDVEVLAKMIGRDLSHWSSLRQLAA